MNGFLVDYAESMQLLSLPKQDNLENKLSALALHILTDIESSDCAVIFKELWAISGRNTAVKKAVNEYYQKLYAMLFEALKKAAPENCEEQQLDNAVVILLPFIEGYCITSSNLKM